MRKAIAIFIALVLIMTFAACGKKEEPTTTAPSTQLTTSSTTLSTTAPTNPTYVLTTGTGQTVPWGETTRFEFDLPTSQVGSTGSSDYDIEFTVSSISKPDVHTSVVATSASTTVPASDNTTFTPTTSAGEEGTTGPEESKGVPIIINSIGGRDGVIIVEIDPSNWSSDLEAGTANVNIIVDGNESTTTPTLTIPSKKNALGFYECTIDISALEIQSGSTVIFTIPAGSIQSTSKTEYNLSYSGTHVV